MQGFNMGRYVPPDQEGLVTSGNRVLGIRAQKANADGVPIVRFEMPFAVWCDGCEKRTIGRDGKNHPVLIGQGVRFNAEKHRTGNYYTTPIFTFRMRHPACGTWLAIRTDPATTSYLVFEGGRKRREYDDEDEEGEPKELDGNAAGPGSESARMNAFDKLERTIAHRAVDTSVESVHRIGDLTRHNARQWDDPYERNRALRAAFRTGRHAREQAAADDEGLRQRLGGLSEDLPLLPESETDARIAALVDFGTVQGLQGADAAMTPRDVVDRINLARPLFEGGPTRAPKRPSRLASPPSPTKTKPTATTLISSRNNKYAATTEVARRQKAVRDHLASTVFANTRMKTDPFVLALDRKTGSPAPGGKARLLPIKGIKRPKEDATPAMDQTSPMSPASKRKRHEDNTIADDSLRESKAAAALVSYDSD
ncbi:hypothetical protein F503_06385 [Ophiostoma piceae UAMH 11346]|uniref:Duf455 domain protein n=1 Tax=Ophiostoma piceae (strain UAMH 11346) TaxID=1262450 RepID=S3BZF3_OPHP1|nr:hypothetical protein F503_06385 [Ophiostoma piceae UAMH 11346]